MTTNSKPRNINLNKVVLLLLFSLSLLTSGLASAQTKSVKFESGAWEDIKIKAAKENKLIFLDAYASWCSICKKMDRTVFTNDSVADYFNRHFINAKIDMEKGEGMNLAALYHVNAYPNLLFLDSQGNLLHRAIGGLQPQEFLALAREAQNPGEQNAGRLKSPEEENNDNAPRAANNLQIGFHINQVQRDFGFGLHVISPYFFMNMFAIKASTNIQWFEHFDSTEVTTTRYQNIQLGMRGRGFSVGDNISVYGEGGMFVILPNTRFSSESFVMGGYGLLGFEFRTGPRLAYFIELGGVGAGAKADKVAGKPIYSNGFLINVGLNIRL